MKKGETNNWLSRCYLLSVLVLMGYSFAAQAMVLDGMILDSYDHYLWEYAENLGKAGAAVLAAGVGYRLLGRFPRLRKRIAVLAGMLMIVCNIYTSVEIAEQWEPDNTVYFRTADWEWETVHRREAVWELYGHCHFAGQADPVFRYPAPEALGWQQEGLRPEAIRERNRLGALFSDWRSGMVFLRVSLRYGYGAALLYLLPVVLWTVCTVLGWKQVRRRQRLLYGTSAVLVMLLLYGPVLDGLGILCYPNFLFGEIPCYASWKEMLLGGLAQMALLGCFLPQPGQTSEEAGADLITRLLLCDKILMGELTVGDITEYEPADCPLPEGIAEGVPFDGSAWEDRGFEPGRTYQVGPVIRRDLRPVIKYPAADGEALDFTDFLVTYTYVDEDFRILEAESYYRCEEFDPENCGF